MHAFELAVAAPPEPGRRTNSAARQLLAEVASRLGNTVAVCRKAYVHPRVLALIMGEAELDAAANGAASARRTPGLSASEQRFVQFLRGAEAAAAAECPTGASRPRTGAGRRRDAPTTTKATPMARPSRTEIDRR